MSELNDKEKALLGNLLNNFKDDLWGISTEDKSHSGFEKISKKANELLQNL
jgi:hypothetical protein